MSHHPITPAERGRTYLEIAAQTVGDAIVSFHRATA